MADQAALLQVRKGGECFLERGVGIKAVEVKQINAVLVQLLAALIKMGGQIGGGRPADITDFCRQIDGVAFRFNELPQKSFRRAVGIHDGGVEMGDARVACGVIHCAAGGRISGAAELHRAECGGGNRGAIGCAEMCHIARFARETKGGNGIGRRFLVGFGVKQQVK